MGARSKLLVGLARMLDDAGAVTWTESGAVPTGASPAPLFRTIYPDTPDIAAALTAYATGGDEPTLSASVLMLQVRTRGSLDDPGAAEDLDDAIGAQLLGHFPQVLSAGTADELRLTIITRESSSPIGRDAAGRMELVTNYRVTIHDPGPHRG